MKSCLSAKPDVAKSMRFFTLEFSSAPPLWGFFLYPFRYKSNHPTYRTAPGFNVEKNDTNLVFGDRSLIESKKKSTKQVFL